MKQLPRTKRQLTLIIVGAIFFLAWMTALFFVIRDTFFSEYAAGEVKRDATESLYLAGGFSGRKNIYDRNFNELAVTFKLTSVYVRPLEVSDPVEASQMLAEAMGLDEKELMHALKSERSFVWLGRHLSEDKLEKVRGLNMQGLYLVDEAQRFYPNRRTAAHVVGFMKDEQGLAGVESYYDNVLRQVSVDDEGLGLTGEASSHVVLSLDLRIQNLVEDKLAGLMKKTGAATGSCVIMEPSTGKILALANLPTFDPNDFWNYSNFERENRAVNEQIYPGGIGRIFRLATAIDLGRKPEQSPLPQKNGYETEEERQHGRYWIKIQDEIYVSPELAFSFDESVSESELADVAFHLGFNQKSAIDLPVSATGIGRLEDSVGGQSMRTSTQEQSTTLLHLLTGFSRLINGGRSVLPQVLDGYWDDDNGFRVEVDHLVKSEAILPATGKEVLQMLKQSAELGPGASIVMESLVDQKKISAIMQSAINLDTTVVGEAQEAKEIVSAPQEESAGNGDAENLNAVFHAVLVGMAPAHEPAVSFVLVLDDARIDLEKPSPLRSMMHSMIRRVAKMAGEKDVRPTPDILESRRGEIFVKWQKSRQQRPSEEKNGPAVDREGGRMPDLQGVSLRKALQILQGYGLDVEIKGSGQVVGQEPAPGKKIVKRKCVLELKVVH